MSSASLARILTAAAIAIALGVPIGLLMGLSRWAKGVFDTPIEFYWPLPPLAYLPLMIIWLGIGEASKITLLTHGDVRPDRDRRAGRRALGLARARQRSALARREPLPADARGRAAVGACRRS